MTAPRELQVGDRVRDNTKRERIMIVKQLALPGLAVLVYEHSAYGTTIEISRIHLDDKPRKTGWSRV